MKKIYLSVLSMICFGVVNAQTLTQANHAPVVGDMYSTKQCDSTGITGGANGAAQTWNYSTIPVHPTVTNYTAVTVASTGSAAAYPSASVAVSAGASKNSFYSSSPSLLQYWGGDLSIGGLGVTLTFTGTAASSYAQYPMGLGTSVNSAVSGTLTTPLGSGTFSGTCNAQGAGTGTLMLPGATFNSVIKISTTQSLSFNVPPAATGNIVENKSDFYATAVSKFPLFTVSSSVLTSTVFGSPQSSSQTIVTISATYPTGIKENIAEAVLSLFPNPAKENITLNFENPQSANASYEVINALGQIVKSENLGTTDGAQTINVSSLNNGVYFIKLKIGNSVTTKKIVIE